MARPRRTDQLEMQTDTACDERVVHIDSVRSARASLPRRDVVAGTTRLFAVLADPTRLRIVAALRERELCVCDVAAVVGQSESAVSHHLKLLREQRIVRDRKDGRRRYYTLDDEHVRELLGLAISHVEHANAVAGGVKV